MPRLTVRPTAMEGPRLAARWPRAARAGRRTRAHPGAVDDLRVPTRSTSVATNATTTSASWRRLVDDSSGWLVTARSYRSGRKRCVDADDSVRRASRAAPSSLHASRYAVVVGQLVWRSFQVHGGTRPGGRRRRWRRRHLDRVPPRRTGLDRRGPGRSGGADVGFDVPLGRARGPAPQLGDADEDDDVQHRAVPAPGRRDRHGPRLARGGIAAAGVQSRAPGGAAPAGRLGQDLRPARRAHHAHRGARALPVDVARRRPRGRLPADRRLARPVGARAGAGGGCPPARRRDPAPHAGRRGRGRARPGDRGDRRAPGRALGDPGGRRRERGRDVRPRDRTARRRHRADHPDGPRVPVHRGDRGRRPHAADDARPRQPRLLPRGGRGPVHGWLRAPSRRRGRSTVSRPTSTASSSPRTGRGSRRSWTGRSGESRPSPTRA